MSSNMLLQHDQGWAELDDVIPEMRLIVAMCRDARREAIRPMPRNIRGNAIKERIFLMKQESEWDFLLNRNGMLEWLLGGRDDLFDGIVNTARKEYKEWRSKRYGKNKNR